ncbi:hypothetical protein CEXT_15171, partial [Caerostris extrusa]
IEIATQNPSLSTVYQVRQGHNSSLPTCATRLRPLTPSRHPTRRPSSQRSLSTEDGVNLVAQSSGGRNRFALKSIDSQMSLPIAFL